MPTYLRKTKLTHSTAKIHRTAYSRIDLSHILNTRLFDFGQAAQGAGWLQSLRENNMIEVEDGKGGKKMVPKPETLE